MDSSFTLTMTPLHRLRLLQSTVSEIGEPLPWSDAKFLKRAVAVFETIAKSYASLPSLVNEEFERRMADESVYDEID